MLNNGQIFDYVNTILRKEAEGNRISPDRFENILGVVSLAYWNKHIVLFEQSKRVSNSLKRFKKSATLTIDGNGLAPYPADYAIVSQIVTSTDKYVDLVTVAEAAERNQDALTVPTATYPIAVLQGSYIQFYPKNLGTATIHYLAYPAEPVFDYVVEDATDKIWYMPVLSNLSTDGTLYEDEDSNSWSDSRAYGSVIVTGASHPDSPSLPYLSRSVDLDWNDEDREMMLALILQELGVNMRDGAVENYAQISEQKETKP
jgi:hypothetical protein